MRGREEAWQRVESQAMRNQHQIQGYSPPFLSRENNSAGIVLSPGADGDNDVVLSFEKVNAEATEVSIILNIVFSHYLLSTLHQLCNLCVH